MADTRKDKRAPISLKVRFKSATLDEFIEQYSVDISRGGIFIKSKTPMSVGTLLKFEFQLKDESRLIHGVGRVVWKRETGSAEDPPGMGIKFIKMDPDSRSMVEEMVKRRGDSPGRFDQGPDSVPAAPSSGGFFPSTTPEDELPAPEDRTQVRHASEFLASALAEGGSSAASKEADKKADEARKRTEEIERRRLEAKKQRTPRIKKTLVGMGIPSAGDEDDDEPPVGLTPRREPPLPESARPAPMAAAPSRQPEPEDPFGGLGLDDDMPSMSEEEDIIASHPPPSRRLDSAPPTLPRRSEPPFMATPISDTGDGGPMEPPLADLDSSPGFNEVPLPTSPARRPLNVELPEARAAEPESKSRIGMILFALVALIAIAVVAYFQFRPPPGVPETDPNIAATDPVVDPLVPPEGETPPEDAIPEDVPPPAPMVAVSVTAEPAGATVYVNGEERGAAPLDVQVPVGTAAIVSARLAGHVEASQEVTATEADNAPIALALEAMPYVIVVSATPATATVRGGGGRLTGAGEIVLSEVPEDTITLNASARNHESGSTSVAPSAFTEQGGRMVASVTITLTARARTPRNPPPDRPPEDPPVGGDPPVEDPPVEDPPEDPPEPPPPANPPPADTPTNPFG